MKDNLRSILVMTVCIALIPCMVFVRTSKAPSDDLTVKIYLTKEKKVCEMTLEEYLTGAVLAQIPYDLNDEAIKAQAVLARTYITSRYLEETDSPTPALHGAFISDDERIYHSFFTEKQAEEFYGDEYSAAKRRIRSAVRSTPFILTYHGAPAAAAFHSASSGYTESALTAWGQDIPYLQAVKSPCEDEYEAASAKTVISADEFKTILAEKFGAEVSGEYDEWLTCKTNERGYVISVFSGETEIDVRQFVSALELSSPCFTFEIKDDSFVFYTHGFGHLVGMSQYGADKMAEDGSTFEDILAYYYQGCTLSRTGDEEDKISP